MADVKAEVSSLTRWVTHLAVVLPTFMQSRDLSGRDKLFIVEPRIYVLQNCVSNCDVACVKFSRIRLRLCRCNLMYMDSKWKQRSLGLSIVLLIFCVLMIWLAIGLEMDRSESIKLFDPQEMDFNGLLPHIKTEYPDYVFKYVVHGGNLPECPIYFVLASKEEEGLTTWPTKTGRVVLLIDNDKCKKLDAMLRSARFFSWRSMWDDAAAHGLNWEITAKTPSGMNRVIVRPDARLSKEVNYLFTRNLRANRDEEDSELRYFQHIFQFKKPSSRPSLAVTRRDSEATGLVKSFFAMLQRVESLAAR